MLFDIEHRTHYLYEEPVGAAGQYIRLTPASARPQTVRDWKISAPGAVHRWRDAYGNICHFRCIDRPRHDLSVLAEGMVETHTADSLYRDNQVSPLPPASFVKHTAYTLAGPTVRELAGLHAGLETNASRDALVGLMQEIRARIDYSPDVTHVETTGEDALRSGEGVCQDHAHALIAVCRHLGVPARYVSGYLWTGDNDFIHAASHAWAEVLVDGAGWFNLDVANNCLADDRYVRLASGHDYADAAPVRGMRGGGGGETMKVEVRIQALDANDPRRHAGRPGKSPGEMPPGQMSAERQQQ